MAKEKTILKEKCCTICKETKELELYPIHGTVCRKCRAVQISAQMRRRNKETKKVGCNNYIIGLMKQFIKAWDEEYRSKIGHECLYMDYKRYLKQHKQYENGHELLQKYITAWETKPHRKQAFEDVYSEYVNLITNGRDCNVQQ